LLLGIDRQWWRALRGIYRQALYRRQSRRPTAAGPGYIDSDDQVIVEVAKANPTDGTRMVAALASRELGRPVNASASSE
jgi:putative transposase